MTAASELALLGATGLVYRDQLTAPTPVKDVAFHFITSAIGDLRFYDVRQEMSKAGGNAALIYAGLADLRIMFVKLQDGKVYRTRIVQIPHNCLVQLQVDFHEKVEEDLERMWPKERCEGCGGHDSGI